MFCWKCGKEIPDEALFCSYCGTEVKSTGTIKADVGPGEKRDYRAFVAIGLIILLLLAAATILIGALSNREKADTAAETPVPAEGSPTAAESPAPAETPAPTEIPEPTETPRPRFISPEQYALENGLDWPEEGSEYRYDIDTVRETAHSWDENVFWNEDSYAMSKEDFQIYSEYADTLYVYVDAYTEARDSGKSDIEAHEAGLDKSDIDKKILGKEVYIKYIYDSAISAGVSEYDAEEFMEQEKLTWDAAWDLYKYARDNGGKHDEAIGSVDWRFFSNANCAEWGRKQERYIKYLEQNLNEKEAFKQTDIEEEKLFELLQYWYEIKREDIIK